MRSSRKAVFFILLIVSFICVFTIFIYVRETRYVKIAEYSEQQLNTVFQKHFEIKLKEEPGHTVKMKITGYAPLDPKAKKGMCYAGDPTITASGRPTQPGITIATDKRFPFGTFIYIPTLGWRVVEDRGGRIKGNRIDVCFNTKQEAIEWGVKELQVKIILPEGE